jgi:hypothetical protein
MSDKLNKIFGIETDIPECIGDLLKVNETQEIVVDVKTPPEHFEVDYTEVRNNLKILIDKGSKAIDGIMHVASEGDSPRAYEVIGQLIKTVAEANKDLIQLHKQIKDIKAGDTVVNNNAETKIGNAIFVGSTAELQKLIKGQVSDIQRLENENP